MKSLLRISVLAGFLGGSLALAAGCGQGEKASGGASAPVEPPKFASNVPPLAPNNIVSLALGSEDHTTLVAAIRAADYVTSVAASGPLTVFAPTNEAFDALPPGTVEGLLEPDKADDLRELLKFHVTTSSLSAASFRDGQKLGMANGAKTTIRVQEGKLSINGANVIASLPASNGTLHIIDAVLLPPAR